MPVIHAVLVALAIALGSTAHAQSDPSASLAGAARDLYRQGVQAGEAGRWDDARELFERSYELSPRDATLLNLATARAQTGRLVSAIEAYRRFLATAEAATRAQGAPVAERAITALEARLAHLTVSARGLAEDDVVSLDGEPISRAAMELDLPIDPGEHAITIARGDRECARRTVTLREAEREDLELVVACPELPAEEAPPVQAPPEDPTPWIVLGVAGGAAVAIGIVIGVVVASLPQDRGAYTGNVGSFVLP